jgi:general stress protein 26
LNPITELDERYSSTGAVAVPWADGESLLEKAGIYWLCSVRPDGRPHVTPLIGLRLEGAFFFCTGPRERKALNLRQNDNVVVTTGTNHYHSGMDVVVEGRAERIVDRPTLQKLADAYLAKYGEDWRFEVGDEGGFGTGDDLAWVFRVASAIAFGFGRGEVASQTKWTFP